MAIDDPTLHPPPPHRFNHAVVSALESLNLAFVLFDEGGAPLYLSTNAATLLHIDQYCAVKTPLNVLSTLLESLSTSSDKLGEIQELHVKSAHGQPLLLLGQICPVSLPPITTDIKLLILHNLSVTHAILANLQQHRNYRPSIILAASLAPSPSDVADVAYQLRTFPVPIHQTTARRSNEHPLDLHRALADAVSIVDPLLPEGVRVIVDTNTSALLNTPRSSFLRILSHLILEASDFVGLAGTVKIRSLVNLDRALPPDTARELVSIARLSIIGERAHVVDTTLTALDQYLASELRRSHPTLSLNMRIVQDLTKSSDLIVERHTQDENKIFFELLLRLSTKATLQSI